MTDSSDQASSGRLLGGRYRLVNILARGGMAEVWVGDDTILSRRVAVKILHANLTADETLRERFRREARAAARMTHPNIVSVYDTGENGDTVYIVMEHVTGDTLRHVLDTGGPLPTARAVEIASQVADALDAAHREGLVHRDVKPANILFDEQERAKVADFGIAKGTGGDLTTTGMVVGTARYLAPEQVSGSEVDARTDVYALALVTFEMLAGRPAFVGDSELSSAVARITGDPPSLREARPDLDPSLVAVVERGYAREAADRWPSSAAFRDALRAAVDSGEETVEEPGVRARSARSSEGAPTTVGSSERRSLFEARSEPSLRSRIPSTERDTAVVATDASAAPSGRARRAWLAPVLLAVLGMAAGVAIIVGALVHSGGGAPEGTPIAIVAASDFDPLGDGAEHPDRVGFAIDGDPTTGWTTQTYATPGFGGLKDGVGLRVDLDGRRDVRAVTVDADPSGWSAEIYVADDPGGALGSWGEPRASGADLPTSARFELPRGSSGSSVLVWITRLAEGGRLVVHGIRVAG